MAKKKVEQAPPGPPLPKPPARIEREAVDMLFGGNEGLDAAIKAYTLALAAHAKTVGIAAPIASHPFVETITKQHAGQYIVVEPPTPVAEVASAPEPEPVVEEPPPPSLDDIKATIKRQISDLKHKKVRAGVRYKGNEFYGDPQAVSAIVATVLAMADEVNVLLRWKAKGGVYVELEKVDLTVLLKLLVKRNQACFDAEYALRSQVDAAATVNALKKIDFNAGWPE